MGRQMVHCGFTMGAPYYSFGCTHCYLPSNANRVPIPSFDEMKAQIDANRRMVGWSGTLQITGGDLPDAYWRGGVRGAGSDRAVRRRGRRGPHGNDPWENTSRSSFLPRTAR